MRFLLYDHSGCLNRGCEAIVRSTTGILRRVFPDCEIGLCSYQPQEDTVLADLGSFTVHETKLNDPTGIKKYINAFYYKVLHSEEYYFKTALADTVRFAKDYDVCLMIGGDTFCYGDNALSRSLTAQFKKLGKKVFAWGCSVGEEDLTEEKIKTLCSMDGVFVRESLSEAVLKKAGVKNLVRLPDPAFTLDKEFLPLPEAWGEKNIGLNFSPLVARRCPNLGSFAVKLVQYIEANTDYTPVLVPHVTIDGNNDYEFLKRIKELSGSKKAVLLPGDLSAKQYKGYIARTDLFLGARTHAIIGAYSSCVPAFALGYSIKARGIATDLFGGETCVRGVGELHSAQDLIDCATELIQKKDTMKQQLEAVIPSFVASSFSAGEKLKELIEKAE